jgi:orotate phosphoribosyltransferase
MANYTKIHTVGTDVPLKVIKGHFATNHAHINYYIDSTTLRTRASEAHEVAKVLAGMYLYDTVVDTIVCMEGTEVIGAFLSEELTNSGFLSTNAHKTIYVVTPEFNNNSQLIFRDNLVPEISGKNVMILMAMVTTGKTLNRALECVKYYNGKLTGVSAIFGENDVIDGVPVHAVFSKKDLPDYESYDYTECPMCKAGQKLDALVNAYGYESLR